MNKEINKFVYKYLGVYGIALIIYWLIELIMECTESGVSCHFDESKLMAFLSVTAYIITPIVAAIGFFSWKDQEDYKQAINLLNENLDKNKELQDLWLEMRKKNTKLFKLLYLQPIEKIKVEENWYNTKKKELDALFNKFSEIDLITDKLYILCSVENNKYELATDQVEQELFGLKSDLNYIRSVYNGKSDFSQDKVDFICSKYCDFCDTTLSFVLNKESLDYEQKIKDMIHNINKEIKNFKDEIKTPSPTKETGVKDNQSL